MNIFSVSSFLEFLSTKDSYPNSECFYRGHSDFTYDLKPTVYRKEKYFVNEASIYREAIINNPQEFYHCKNTLEVLVKMQHYGIPTRLLDITRNPLVALFFACYELETLNGEVVLLNIPSTSVRFYDSDKVTILSNIAKQEISFGFDYRDDFDSSNKEHIHEVNNEYFGYLLHSIREDKPHFFDIINPKDIEEALAVQVKLDNPRIIKQNGAFLIFGIKKSEDGALGKTICVDVDQKWFALPNNERLVIQANDKKSILHELNVLGINKSSLFPELNDFGEHIKIKYKIPS